MIKLSSDFLIVKTSAGGQGPVPAERLSYGLFGNRMTPCRSVMRNVTAIVTHHFREDLGRDHVTVAEYSEVFQDVLAKFDCETVPAR